MLGFHWFENQFVYLSALNLVSYPHRNHVACKMTFVHIEVVALERILMLARVD